MSEFKARNFRQQRLPHLFSILFHIWIIFIFINETCKIYFRSLKEVISIYLILNYFYFLFFNSHLVYYMTSKQSDTKMNRSLSLLLKAYFFPFYILKLKSEIKFKLSINSNSCKCKENNNKNDEEQECKRVRSHKNLIEII